MDLRGGALRAAVRSWQASVGDCALLVATSGRAAQAFLDTHLCSMTQRWHLQPSVGGRLYASTFSRTLALITCL
jgi:hypothetical protein